MLLIYKSIPAKTIRKDAREAIPKIKAWFKANPDRKECNAELWYGKQLKIKADTVEEQVNAAAAEAIGNDKKTPKTKKVAPKKAKK